MPNDILLYEISFGILGVSLRTLVALVIREIGDIIYETKTFYRSYVRACL